MAKTLPSSGGYFNKKMLAILESDTKKSTSKNTAGKKASQSATSKKK